MKPLKLLLAHFVLTLIISCQNPENVHSNLNAQTTKMDTLPFEQLKIKLDKVVDKITVDNKCIDCEDEYPHIFDYENTEWVTILDSSTQKQKIALTEYLLNQNKIVSKCIAIDIIAPVFNDHSNSKVKAIELLCEHYIPDNILIQLVDNLLLDCNAQDYSLKAKSFLVKNIPNMNEYFARILAVAQVKESIPELWKMANKDIATIGPNDLDVLASLARLGEQKAAALLCESYQFTKQSSKGNSNSQVFIAKHLSFSLHPEVLNCLLLDFKSMNISTSFDYGDTGYSPSHILGKEIVSMLSNYPYEKAENFNALKCKLWLVTKPTLTIKTK